MSADVAANGAPGAEGTEQQNPAECHREAALVGKEVVSTGAIGRVERVEGQVLGYPVGVDQPEEPDQQVLDDENPDERYDERGDLAVYDRADRDADQRPENGREDLLTGTGQELGVA